MSGDHWRLKLNNLMQATYGVQNLRWEQYQAGPQHTAPWTAIAYIRNVEWGRGSSHILADAKEAAAQMAYRALYKEVYGTYPQ
ncbi:hypothetical protein PHLGIDRAFT_114299 [Phlebiopsis gigantea 11061_1 CR5-6]|uniref:DRBM domain-containing protein n=1 Tax=Phlebiopsis gigantea (strain 11061_1 CR5-6) TaxID=745531 RepID=A0A0C3SFA0_PHLG1|nr:hypothetical protein PHLGIDRAFT_114299 [Phlebiopsis gigantea 11061_1 CR5-6]